MFREDGACYIALPAHVAGPLPKVTVATSVPVVTDQATVVRPFWEGIDLAIAVPDQGVLGRRCAQNLDDLRPDAVSRTARVVDLLRVRPSGETVSTPMRVLRRDYLTLEAETMENSTPIAQGTSGAFAFAGAKPVGMAITSDGPNHARFIRSEEMLIHLERYINAQAQAFAQSASFETDAAGSGPTESSGLDIAEISASHDPVLPQFGPANLRGPGVFVPNADEAFDVLVRLDTTSPIAVRRVRVTAANGAYAVPRQIVISLGTGSEPSRLRYWTQGQMSPDGTFDTGNLAPRNAKWIQLRAVGAWRTGQVALDQIVIE